MSIKTQGWPVHSQDEIDAVKNVLESGCTNYWTGLQGKNFESEFAAYVGSTYAIALMNGTVALEGALYALGIGEGDEVITPSRTFIASASCIVMRGAKPVIADVDLDSQNLTPETIRPCLSSRTKAIVVVHLAGRPADMEGILKLAQEYKLKVIEDCAQAHGAKIKNQHVGTWGDIGAFSFCQDKIMTTGGEGGMITTNDKNLWEKIWSFKDHGKNYEKVHQASHPPGFRWLHDSFGTNWRMTEMQAAIGRQQLKKLPLWTIIRNKNAAILSEYLKQHSCLRIPDLPLDAVHANYKFYVFVRPENLKPSWNRDKILQEINDRGIPCFTGICSEIYLERAFETLELSIPTKPNARQLAKTSLMFLVHPTITEVEMHKTGEMLEEIFSSATQPITSLMNTELQN